MESDFNSWCHLAFAEPLQQTMDIMVMSPFSSPKSATNLRFEFHFAASSLQVFVNQSPITFQLSSILRISSYRQFRQPERPHRVLECPARGHQPKDHTGHLPQQAEGNSRPAPDAHKDHTGHSPKQAGGQAPPGANKPKPPQRRGTRRSKQPTTNDLGYSPKRAEGQAPPRRNQRPHRGTRQSKQRAKPGPRRIQ